MALLGLCSNEHQLGVITYGRDIYIVAVCASERGYRRGQKPAAAVNCCVHLALPCFRFTRSVPGVCPLAEIKHPLYAVGSLDHSISE